AAGASSPLSRRTAATSTAAVRLRLAAPRGRIACGIAATFAARAIVALRLARLALARRTRIAIAAAEGTALPLRATAVLDRLRLGVRVRLETFDDALFELALQKTLDVAQQLELIHAHQRNRLARGAGAAGAADAVHIVFGDVRQLVIHHM